MRCIHIDSLGARHFRVQLRKAAIEWAGITGKTNNTLGATTQSERQEVK
jgi:hypothetical protein